jgi:hypothetical protein
MPLSVRARSSEGAYMLRGKFFGHRLGARVLAASQARLIVAKAAMPVICESLEDRRLLSTYSHTVTSGHPNVYLEPGFSAGQVDVHLDSPTGPVDHQFFNPDGMDIITNPASNFTFFDQVPAARKPTSDGTDFGTKVQGGSAGTLGKTGTVT